MVVNPATVEFCIPAYNEAATIAGVLDSIRRQAGVVVTRVTVLANGCTDATAALARRSILDDIPVTVIETSWRSKARAWQLLLDRVVCPIAVFVDGDVVFGPGTTARLVENLDAHPRFTATTACPWPIKACHHSIDRLITLPAGPVEPTGIVGACYAVRPDLLRQLLHQADGSQMPPDVIAEDRWLTLLLHDGRWGSARGCEVRYRYPAIRDLVPQAKRHYRARKQFVGKFDHVTAVSPSGRPPISLAVLIRKLHREWESRPSVVWFLGRVYTAILLRAVALYARCSLILDDPPDGSVQWERTPSTKTPIPVGDRT